MSLKINNLTVYGTKSLNLAETKCGICMEFLYDSCDQCQIIEKKEQEIKSDSLVSDLESKERENKENENKEKTKKNKENNMFDIENFSTDADIIKFFNKTIDNRQSFFCSKEDASREINTNHNHNDCFGVVGICNHAYHHCCISKTLKNKSSWQHKCPLCDNKWEMKKKLNKFT
jgi:hypothetical protein